VPDVSESALGVNTRVGAAAPTGHRSRRNTGSCRAGLWRSVPSNSRRGRVLSVDGDGLRLVELMAALSLATDLGTGQPMEHALLNAAKPAIVFPPILKAGTP
jgi:hypothetical protein